MKLKQDITANNSSKAQPIQSGTSAVSKWIRSLGPGVITAALVFGPGSLTISSKLGTMYGYTLLWVLVFSAFFMLVFTAMAARIGMATNQSLLSVIRRKWGKAAAVTIGIGIFLVTASFQAGNTIGASVAFAELFHTSSTPWIFIFTLLGFSLLFIKSFYKVLENIMMLLVGLMLIAFITTFIWAKPDITSILMGLIPTVPKGSEMLVIALIASSFSIVGAFYQSYLVQERRQSGPEVQESAKDSFIGIVILGLMGSVVLASAAAVLHPLGVQINSATDMAKALEPLFGSWAFTLFMCGLFGASFSSLIGNATIGGSLLGDALGLGRELRSSTVRLLIALVMLLGSVIALMFGKLPLELIVFAQGITILIVPFIGIALYAIANDSSVMHELKNTTTSKILGAIGLVILFLLALGNVKGLFF